MDSREILDFGPGHFEVWDFHGNKVFEGATHEECEAWIDSMEWHDSQEYPSVT